MSEELINALYDIQRKQESIDSKLYELQLKQNKFHQEIYQIISGWIYDVGSPTNNVISILNDIKNDQQYLLNDIILILRSIENGGKL